MFSVKDMDGALSYNDIRAIKALKRIREPRNTVGILERITRRFLLFHNQIVHLQMTKHIMMRATEQYILVIRLFRDFPVVIDALEEIWETIDVEDEIPVAMRYYFSQLSLPLRWNSNSHKNKSIEFLRIFQEEFLRLTKMMIMKR